jgi:hypothetical protein
MEKYNATSPPEIIVIIKPWKGPAADTSQTIVLVFHAFEPVIWKVYSEHFPVGTKFIIKVCFFFIPSKHEIRDLRG